MTAPLPNRRRAAIAKVIATILGMTGAALAPIATHSAAAAPAAQAELQDNFTRVVSDGWGTPPAGGTYAMSGLGNGSTASVDGNDGVVVVARAGASVEAALSASLLDTEVLVSVATDKDATGWGQVTYVAGRQTAPLKEYRVRIRRASNGGVHLAVTRTLGTHTETPLGSEIAVPGLQPTAGQAINVRLIMFGTNPTRIEARAWADGAAEPGQWQISATDTANELQAPGSVALRSYISGSTTNAPVRFSYKSLRMVDHAAQPTTTTTTTTPAPPPPPSYGAPVLGSTSYSVPSNAIVVAPGGKDSNAGTWSSPFATITKAVDAAPNGATIVLRAGTYHEQVHILAKRVTIQSAPGEVVWLDGSSRVEGWVQDGNAWRHAGWTTRLPRLSPTNPMVTAPGSPEAARPDQVFVDGVALRQVLTRSAVVSGTFFLDESTSDLYVGDDVRTKEVRASDLQYAFDVNLSGGSVLRGIGVRRYGTPISRIAAVFVQSPDVTVTDMVIVDNAAAGLSMSAVRGTVRRVTTNRNGQMGLHSRQADGLIVDTLLSETNNVAGFANNQAAGGVKIHSTRGFRLERSLISDNRGVGVWFDESTTGGTVAWNRSLRNDRSGFQFELSSKTTFAGNVAADNAEWGIYVLESSDVEIWNNTLIRNQRAIQVFEGVREQTNPNDDGHDSRYGTNNPDIPWNVAGIRIRNNVFSGARPDSVTLFGVDDSRKQASGHDMGVSSDHNAWYRGASASSPRWLANWSMWPVRMTVGTTLSEWRSVSGQDANSVITENVPTSPYVADEASGNYALPANSPARSIGAPLPATIASVLELPTGVPSPVGVPR